MQHLPQDAAGPAPAVQGMTCPHLGGHEGAVGLAPGGLRPVAEAVGVLALAVAQVQRHGGVLGVERGVELEGVYIS